MSDCSVCVYSGYEGSYSDFFSESIHKAAKQHRCCECDKQIQAGERYARYAGKTDGYFWSERCCLICDEIADAFCCDGRMFGNFWSDMYECFGALTTSCFDRLSTPEAKAELRRRWMAWKGLLQ